MNKLVELGFKPVEREYVQHPDDATVRGVIDQWTKKVVDKKNPYPVDGLVIGYDDTVYASTGSVTGHHATRAGYAFKWQDESADTVLRTIEWSCAASTITPVAIFDPVDLEGTVVKRASLANISECERLGIGGEGTEIAVIKANKIIPKVIKVHKTVGYLHIPETCPVCGSPTKIRISDVSATKTLVCTNPDCSAKKLKKFGRFVSKNGVDMDGVSEQTIFRFVNMGWIRENADIYKLKEHKGEISQLDGFGERSEANILQSVENSRTVDAEKLLVALTIPLCGGDVARRLLGAYRFEELVQLCETTDDEEVFASIDGIGPEKSRSVVNWFRDERNRNELHNLLNEITVKQETREAAGNKCEGLIFVVTGDVYHYKNRDELKAYIESQGGKVTGSVTGKTSFLINNDINSTSGKNQKARQLNVPVISEDEFITRFG